VQFRAQRGDARTKDRFEKDRTGMAPARGHREYLGQLDFLKDDEQPPVGEAVTTIFIPAANSASERRSPPA
jgi:hypothetical protein